MIPNGGFYVYSYQSKEGTGRKRNIRTLVLWSVSSNLKGKVLKMTDGLREEYEDSQEVRRTENV